MKRVTDKNYFIDPWLAANLETGLHNIPRDFDLVILVSGNGMVRVGKSVLAQQVGYYCAYKLGTGFSIKNVVFSGHELMTVAKELPPNSVIIYDEARGELDSKKVMENVTKQLIDFLNECGYMNHVLIFVLPDFFDLPKYVACNRSDFLLNVYRTSTPSKNRQGEEVMRYDRGYFEFYNRERKKRLYIMGKKEYNDYGVGKPNFRGTFPSDDIIDHALYSEKKKSYVARDRAKTNEKDNSRFAAALRCMNKVLTQEQITQLLHKEGVTLDRTTINKIMTGYIHPSKLVKSEKLSI